jgi:hypothetical protein
MTQKQNFWQSGKTVYNVPELENHGNTVFQATVSKTDIFKFCYHGFSRLLIAQI